ncbi:MAG: GNAT family N-acetyltransferase [Bacilli bacterium]|nr:GNAT family N-acetyltransferase [Bacilli bacterium]
MKLVKPTVELENNWLNYFNEYTKGNNSSPMEYKKEYIYSEWIKKLDNEEKGIDLEPGRVPSSVRFLMDDGKILGAVSIRHSIDNEFLSNIGGHIGYGILPSERKKGYGKLILKLSLEECKKLGINKVLVTCVDSNIGSKKIIESNGGILENKIFFEPENDYICRYYIKL